MRKPIQVAITQGSEFEPAATLIVCDDGSIWGLCGGKWHRLPDIPQDDQEDLPQMLIEQNG